MQWKVEKVESKVDIYIYCWCSSWKAILSSLNQVNSFQSDSFNSGDILQEKTILLQFTQVDQRNIFSLLTMVKHLDSLTKPSFLLTFRLENLGKTLMIEEASHLFDISFWDHCQYYTTNSYYDTPPKQFKRTGSTREIE